MTLPGIINHPSIPIVANWLTVITSIYILLRWIIHLLQNTKVIRMLSQLMNPKVWRILGFLVDVWIAWNILIILSSSDINYLSPAFFLLFAIYIRKSSK